MARKFKAVCRFKEAVAAAADNAFDLLPEDKPLLSETPDFSDMAAEIAGDMLKQKHQPVAKTDLDLVAQEDDDEP
jgi:hypothetical protein